jgi:hypothetical protein
MFQTFNSYRWENIQQGRQISSHRLQLQAYFQAQKERKELIINMLGRLLGFPVYKYDIYLLLSSYNRTVKQLLVEVQFVNIVHS